MAKRVPLAWLQLTHEKLRLLAAVSGIAFAVVMILLQLGVQYAVLTAASLVQDALGGEIVLTSKQYDYLVASKQFTRRRLYQALAFDGVESVWPVYMTLAQWKNPEDLHERGIFIIGTDPAAGIRPHRAHCAGQRIAAGRGEWSGHSGHWVVSDGGFIRH